MLDLSLVPLLQLQECPGRTSRIRNVLGKKSGGMLHDDAMIGFFSEPFFWSLSMIAILLFPQLNHGKFVIN